VSIFKCYRILVGNQLESKSQDNSTAIGTNSTKVEKMLEEHGKAAEGTCLGLTFGFCAAGFIKAKDILGDILFR